MIPDPYDDSSFVRFYDWAYSGMQDDLQMYINLGEIHGPRFLELGCGSGRISIPLARSGFTITALDLSEEMLMCAREHLKEEPAEVKNKITFIKGDMSSFKTDGLFDVVFVPYSSIYHLDSISKKLSCLERMADHLSPDGTAVIDLVNPLIMECQDTGDSFTAKEGVNPRTGKNTVQLYNVTVHQKEKQLLEVEHVFTEETGETHSFSQTFWWLNGEQISSLLCHAGFKDIDVFGDYDMSPYSPESDRLICSARK